MWLRTSHKACVPPIANGSITRGNAASDYNGSKYSSRYTGKYADSCRYIDVNGNHNTNADTGTNGNRNTNANAETDTKTIRNTYDGRRYITAHEDSYLQ